jgi:hypothetical protein
MKVQNGVCDAGRGELPQNPSNQRLSRNGQGSLGSDERQRTQAGREARRQHERWNHRG